MKAKLLAVFTLLCGFAYGQTELTPTAESCNASYGCSASYADGFKAYAQALYGPDVYLVNGATIIHAGTFYSPAAGTVTNLSYTDSTGFHMILNFNGASVSTGGTASGTVTVSFTRVCRSGRGGGCTVKITQPMAVSYAIQ